MKAALLSPLPPTRSGVAHYASMLVPALQGRVDVTAFGSLDGYRRDDFDVAIYQLGNNPHHAFVYAEAMERPGVAVLHDVVLHHLIVEMTLARGDVEGYVDALRASHGEAGAAWARGRAAGLHSEMGNFLLPGSIEVARRSRAVIVHNGWAADLLRSLGVETPIHVVPHPYEPDTVHHEPLPVRTLLGITPDDRVIGLFGFLTSAKRGEVVVEAFRRARERNAHLRLLVVGEPAPNIDLTSIQGEGVIVTGYVSDDDFGRYYAAADRLVNLRYPSAGESSGTLIRAFAAGKPVAVSDYAQFAEYPDDCVVRIAFGEREVEDLTAFFLDDLDTRNIAAAQRAWLESNARIELTVDGYVKALANGAVDSEGRTSKVEGRLPLFPRIVLAGVAFEDGAARLTLRNDGDSPLRARVYGEPAYRLLVKLFDESGEVADYWLQLAGDLLPGATAEIGVPLQDRAVTLRIYHALEGIPIIDPMPAAEVGVARV
ncbi:MAG TPA: glycosyltransferase family 4 protein [Thermoanaerobaculia bacterium]|nr:glycosyltransferase family 4 protein [Thermoanaerobaculia bacterium]